MSVRSFPVSHRLIHLFTGVFSGDCLSKKRFLIEASKVTKRRVSFSGVLGSGELGFALTGAKMGLVQKSHSKNTHRKELPGH